LTIIHINFKEVINELAGEPALEKFKAEFEKVHRALIEANQSNTKLAQKERSRLIKEQLLKTFSKEKIIKLKMVSV